MKKFILLVVPLLLIGSLIAWAAGTYKITPANVQNPNALVRLLNQFDAQLDSMIDHWTTRDFVFSDPGLTVGSSAPAKIKCSNTWYVINGVLGYVASTETTMTGDAVPVNKYGAWALEIGTNGTIDCVPATANGTGYTTAALAVAALPAAATDHARLGYVTAMHAGGIAFTPGTTEWSTAGVTEAYTDLLPTANITTDVISRGK